MRIIKLAIISILVFSFIITCISFLFPSNVRISKAIDITANRDSVLHKLSDVREWKYWYPGADTLDLLVENGSAKGLRISNQDGHLIITGSTDSTVTAATAGKGVRKMKTGWNVFQASTPNTHTVQWYMDFHLRWYPWEKFSSLLLEKRYGPSMEKGLDQLKKILEKK